VLIVDPLAFACEPLKALAHAWRLDEFGDNFRGRNAFTKVTGKFRMCRQVSSVASGCLGADGWEA
jgi:hypothetical protein